MQHIIALFNSLCQLSVITFIYHATLQQLLIKMLPLAGYVMIPADNHILYGKHFPNGNAAVEYIYGPEGTWIPLSTLVYTYNYYEKYATTQHPYNKGVLIKEAENQAHTCRDANGHLLFDKDGTEREIVQPLPQNAFAFCEHTGKGLNIRGKPFYNCWYDDNTLAINLSRVYKKPMPAGLYPYKDFIRWSVIGDSIGNYKVYGTDHIDCLALDGLYFYRTGDFEKSYKKFKRILEVSHPTYDKESQRFEYNMPDVYHFGLSAILAAILLDCEYLPVAKRNEAMQHYVSLRSDILSKQVVENGIMKGWLSGYKKTDLINTETVSANVLALGIGADLVFEGGKPPLDYSKSSNFFIRSHNVISAAVEGGSKPGLLSCGPYWKFEGGYSYCVEFYVRAESPKDCGAIISVVDSINKVILARTRVVFVEGGAGLNWTKVSLVFALSKTTALSFECYWMGGSSSKQNMDLAFIRVKGAQVDTCFV
eukprot:TRINITY_DN88079_c3_g1_i1.p1 TRINITY_DN88079_c3_g1~~TRINITY_DN88079_c3_g1_i1.p1  ORF type:complete len:480 (-),score=26.24 TRINITY_DN88079_c3_g1_i1:2318-3757(-)